MEGFKQEHRRNDPKRGEIGPPPEAYADYHKAHKTPTKTAPKPDKPKEGGK